MRRQRERYPERHRLQNWKKYGIDLTWGEYLDMLKKQKGKCLGCGREPTGKYPLGVDHDHETGRVRGLLCPPCNKRDVLANA